VGLLDDQVNFDDSRGKQLTRLETFSAWFVLQYGWQRYLAALAAGLLSAFAMAPFYFVSILFLTFPVFVWLMDGVYADGKTGWISAFKRQFLTGWWFGFGYFLLSFWWLGNAFLVEAEDFAWALPIAVIALPAGLAIFWGFGANLCRILWSDHWTRALAFALAFSAVEYLRGTLFTGLPWNAPGYSVMSMPIAMQSSALVGLYAMNFFTFVVCTLPLVAIASPRSLLPNRTVPIILSLLLIAGHLGYGAWRLNQYPTQYSDEINLRLMQPSIDQRTKFDIDKEAEIIDNYLELSAKPKPDGSDGLAGTDYVIWPESAFPFLLTERRDVLSSIGDLLPAGTKLITGALRAEPGAAGNPYGKVYNSIYVIADNGEIEEASDKTHLVPFGEYLPYQEMLEGIGLEQLTRLRGGFEAGAVRKVLASDTSHPFLPLICYEVVFPNQIQSESSVEPKWIVNLTNDGWFGFTPGPYQHFHQTLVRGVEEGLPVIRVANTGFSAVSDPMGRVLQKLSLGERDVIDTALPIGATKTLYSRVGNLPFGLAWLFVLLLVLWKTRSKHAFG